MTLLLHISDTHFGTEKPRVVAALQALARERRPDALVFSGDITQRATPGQFAAARRFCDSLGIEPVLALPGNHDIPLLHIGARLLSPYGRYRKAFGAELQPVIALPDLLLVGVNTTRPLLHKDGAVSPQQVERVVALLAQAQPRQLRVVVTHQPADVVREEDRKDRLRDAEPALQAWSRAGADLVLGGHIHLPFILDLAGRSQPTPRPMWVVQAGTAVSDRVRHGTCNSVNVIHWRWPAPGAARTCRVERCDYDPAQDRFVTATNTVLALGEL